MLPFHSLPLDFDINYGLSLFEVVLTSVMDCNYYSWNFYTLVSCLSPYVKFNIFSHFITLTLNIKLSIFYFSKIPLIRLNSDSHLLYFILVTTLSFLLKFNYRDALNPIPIDISVYLVNISGSDLTDFLILFTAVFYTTACTMMAGTTQITDMRTGHRLSYTTLPSDLMFHIT